MVLLKKFIQKQKRILYEKVCELLEVKHDQGKTCKQKKDG
jgi:hypothetical protein